MLSTVCPIQCVKSGCSEPDWLEKHNSFVLSLFATISAALGILLTYFLKSRCKSIKTPCISCDRDVIDLEAGHANVSQA